MKLQLRIASESKTGDSSIEDSDGDKDFTVEVGIGENGMYFVSVSAVSFSLSEFYKLFLFKQINIFWEIAMFSDNIAF